MKGKVYLDQNYDVTGVAVPEILLPDTRDFTSWAVVACDQFTSEKEYWETLREKTQGKRTALDLVLPEAYLQKDNSDRINAINRNMQEYLDAGVFRNLGAGFVLVARSTPHTDLRLGLMIAVDLEKYSYEKKSDALIRATEGTILDRLPPRVEIRKNAPLEFPHIMLLADDAERTVIEPLYANRDCLQKVYDFDLNMGGGHLTGWLVTETEAVTTALSSLAKQSAEKYGTPFLFAVGDGNHSLATAKRCWENLKPTLSEEQLATHPARFALCELVNIYDDGLQFEPIHRYVVGVDTTAFMENWQDTDQKIRGTLITADGDRQITLSEDIAKAVSKADEYAKQVDCEEVDYVHGEQNLRALVQKNKNSAGILLPAMEKSGLFRSVAANGSLPRKTFSMGEAVEKRYYVEGKFIQ